MNDQNMCLLQVTTSGVCRRRPCSYTWNDARPVITRSRRTVAALTWPVPAVRSSSVGCVEPTGQDTITRAVDKYPNSYAIVVLLLFFFRFLFSGC